MSPTSPSELAPRLGSGLLSFPITPFTADLAFDADAYREHLDWLKSYPVAGLFAAGGTGEFFSLTAAEVDRVVTTAVDQVAGTVPVLATAQVVIEAYPLTEAGPDGLAEHIAAVCEATSLGVVFYHRANARISVAALQRVADRCPNLIGFKDGVGDLELMTRIYATLGDRFVYVGGLPTAETFALPYLQLGVTTYSSAIFNFAPQWALDFYAAVRAQNRDEVYQRLRDFVLPYLAIRDRTPGYAVSIIKAGLDAAGRYGGPVRPPLTGLKPTEREELAALVASIS